MLSLMFRFMFADICLEKNQNCKILVMFIINVRESSFNLCKFGMLSINMNHNIGKNPIL